MRWVKVTFTAAVFTEFFTVHEKGRAFGAEIGLPPDSKLIDIFFEPETDSLMGVAVFENRLFEDVKEEEVPYINVTFNSFVLDSVKGPVAKTVKLYNAKGKLKADQGDD